MVTKNAPAPRSPWLSHTYAPLKPTPPAHYRHFAQPYHGLAFGLHKAMVHIVSMNLTHFNWGPGGHKISVSERTCRQVCVSTGPVCGLRRQHGTELAPVIPRKNFVTARWWLFLFFRSLIYIYISNFRFF